LVESEFGLCGPCWRDTPFITGLTCEGCGTPLMGDSDDPEFCDDCLSLSPPWARGRAAFLYEGNARKMILALKHGDRHEIARGAGQWMVNAGRDLLRQDAILAPIPLHWTRMVKRRFNQAALLARSVSRISGLTYCPDLLHRTRKTSSTEGMSREERFTQIEGSMIIPPSRRALIAGKSVVLVDDVMTTGATFSAATQACLVAGACDVSALVLARVAMKP
jgi:ComF family protein